ncbi:RNA recognition motif containing protein [Babesia caballi]|uniref:RNA recognition motif containing protein n=1 Tax=Babesia caballi TaxID=5871 RepID=A0AAV4M1R6_BABCB|nr:RNA recognition motif containing protein [Babesia caballi]
MDQASADNKAMEVEIATDDQGANGSAIDEIDSHKTDGPQHHATECDATDSVTECATVPEHVIAPEHGLTAEHVTEAAPLSTPEPVEKPSHTAETDRPSTPEHASTTEQVPASDSAPAPSQPEPAQASHSRKAITEDDRVKLRALVDLVVSFGNRLAEAQAGADDDEEGAVEEDEVPFERVNGSVSHSNVVRLLNLPPEMDMEALTAAIGGMADIVLHSFVYRATEVKIIFVNVAVASEARKLLDLLRLHNRTIQAVLSNAEDFNSLPTPSVAPSRPMPPGPVAPLPPLAAIKLPPPRRGLPPLPPVPPVFPLPPLPPGIVPPLSPVRLPPRCPVRPPPFIPPNRFPEPPDRKAGMMPAPVPLPLPLTGATTQEPPTKTPFGRNLYRREGKSLYDLLVSLPQVSTWDQAQSLENQQRNYDSLHAEFGITNRYLLLGGLPDTATESISAAWEWLSKQTQKKVELEICQMEQYAAARGLTNARFLHLTFQRRADCTEVFGQLTSQFPDLVCRFSAPRKAFDTLWVGNIADALSYCRDEQEMKDLFERLGNMKVYRFSPEKGCFFVTYATIEDAVRVRNRLLGASFSSVKTLALNVDYTLDIAPRMPLRSMLPPSEPRPASGGNGHNGSNGSNGDLSQKLGERLLSALQRRSDGDVLIRQLLDGRDSDAVNLLTRGPQRPYSHRVYDNRYPEPHRYARGPSPGGYGPTPWSRSRKRPYFPPDLPPEAFKHRRPGPAPGELSPGEYFHAGPQEPLHPPPRMPALSSPGPRPYEERSPEPRVPLEVVRPKPPRMIMCDLLKRGKPICKVSALFTRGDMSHRLPQTLDVNQRANPERLANYLQKGPELSLWQLGADSNEDSVKYDGLCDYLISKNRVALVQEGPYEIYIVPPSEKCALAPSLPDAQFMYAFVLPKGS